MYTTVTGILTRSQQASHTVASTEPTPSPEAPPDKLSEILEGLSSRDDYLRVYELEPTGNPKYLKRLYPSQVDDVLDAVRDAWGGGDFELQEVKGGRNGRRVRVSVAGPPKNRPGSGPVVVEQSPHVEPPARDIVEAVERLERMYRELRNPPPVANAGDPMAMAVNIVNAFQSAMAPLLAALLDRPKDPPADTSREILKAFTAGLQAAANLDRPKGGGPSHWDRLIDEVALPLVRTANGARAGAPPGAPALGPGEPAAPPASGPWYEVIAGHMPELSRLAAQGASAPMIARSLSTQAPDDFLDELMDEVSAGEPFWAEFFTRFPDTRRDEAWWRALVGQLWHESFAPDEEEEAAEG